MDESSDKAIDGADDPAELESAMFEWALDHNLNNLIQFHNVVRALLAEKINDDDGGIDHGVKHTLRRYQEVNAANALLLLIGYLEEMLLLLWRRTWSVPLPEHHTSIDRYKPLLVEAGINLGTFADWVILKDAMRVRHCILHSNSRLSLLRDPDDMRGCLKRYPDGLTLQLDRVVVTSQFLKICVDATRNTRDSLVRGLRSRVR